jgi:hypothetical protein
VLAAGVGQVTLPAAGSDTATVARLTLPMLVTLYVYRIVSPTWTAFWSPAGVTVAVLSSETAGSGNEEVETLDGGDVALPPWRSPPVAVAVSVTPPRSTSAWVTT